MATALERQARLNAKAVARWGVAVVLDGVSVVGDFTAPQRQVEMGDGMQIAARRPMVTVVDADVPASPVGKSLVHSATTYTVAEARPDGLGLTVLELERVL